MISHNKQQCTNFTEPLCGNIANYMIYKLNVKCSTDGRQVTTSSKHGERLFHRDDLDNNKHKKINEIL